MPRSEGALWIGRTALLTWLIYLLIAPTIGFHWIESWHNEQRAVEVLLLACTAVAYCMIGLLDRPEQSAARWYLPPILLAFLGLGLLSATRAQFVFAALAEVSMFALLAILAMLTARIVSTDVRRYVRWGRWFALLFATAYVLGVATRYLAAVNLDRAVDLDVWILGYANPRFPSALHAVLIPLLALTAIEKTELGSLRAVATIVLSLIWTINLGLGTRGIWFAYAIGIALTALLIGWRPMVRLIVALTLTAIAGIGLYFVLFSLTSAVTGLPVAVHAPIDNLTTVTSREVLWNLSWQSIQSSPWLGIGPMQFAALNSRVGAHPHNWPLQIAAEWGLPALALLCFAIFRLGQGVRRRAEIDYTVASMTLIVVVALTLGLVDGNLVMPVSQIATTLAVGMLIGVVSQEKYVVSNERISASAMMLTAFAGIVASGIVITFAMTSLGDQPRSSATFQRSYPGDWFVPRFWEQGNLLD